MVRKLATVAVLSIASLIGAVQSWKYQGHLLGKLNIREKELSMRDPTKILSKGREISC